MIHPLLFCLLLALGLATAEDGSQAWLRYAPVVSTPQDNNHRSLPLTIVALNSSKESPVYTAGQELQKGIKGVLGKYLPVNNTGGRTSAIIVGTADEYQTKYGTVKEVKDLEQDGFFLSVEANKVRIIGQNQRGALYGAFEYLSRIAQGNFEPVSIVENPHAPIRWTNEWDNLDGSIERGYAGPSFFFRNGFVVDNITRVAEYARLLASIRINGIIVNNVNANASLLSTRNMDGLGRLADAIRPWGIQLGISLNFASPQTFGGLSSFDPLDPKVDAWWANITNQIYHHVPDMAGYLVKANSEGQPGPLTYNRTLAEGANMFARAAKPHGGIIMFRAFVYDNHINYSNWTADRANAAVDFFKDLDGKFDDNVVVQIKYGPIDFQVREPPSPLFSTLHKTSTAIELQVSQEYLGQQTHLVYLAPLWKELLEYDLRADNKPSKVKDIISGKRFARPLGGSAGVVNVGTNTTWLGSHLAMSVS
jgi:alpha-glucuronidase